MAVRFEDASEPQDGAFDEAFAWDDSSDVPHDVEPLDARDFRPPTNEERRADRELAARARRVLRRSPAVRPVAPRAPRAHQKYGHGRLKRAGQGRARRTRTPQRSRVFRPSRAARSRSPDPDGPGPTKPVVAASAISEQCGELARRSELARHVRGSKKRGARLGASASTSLANVAAAHRSERDASACGGGRDACSHLAAQYDARVDARSRLALGGSGPPCVRHEENTSEEKNTDA